MNETFKPPTTLRPARLLAGYTQESLAKAVKRSQPWICRAEHGSGALVTNEDSQRLASALGVPPEKLFTELPE